jgi:hypothetical protein
MRIELKAPGDRRHATEARPDDRREVSWIVLTAQGYGHDNDAAQSIVPALCPTLLPLFVYEENVEHFRCFPYAGDARWDR